MAKKKPKPHAIFQNDQERIVELKLCLEEVKDLLFNAPANNLVGTLGQCHSLIRNVLTWFEQDQKYLTQTATMYGDSKGFNFTMVEPLIIVHHKKD